MPASPPPDFNDSPLDALLRHADGAQRPPVDSWHGGRRGTIDMRITADGRWWHEGGEIKRPAMVKLFSSILRREADGAHVLVTPHECLTISVDDAAFVAQELRVESAGETQQLLFRLNTGDIIVAGPDHPLLVRDGPAGPLPYLVVVRGQTGVLEARLARPVYYALAELADADGAVVSGGARFVIGAAA